MKITTLNFEQISDILDIAVCDNKPFAIMCYGDLAKDIKIYMAEMYDIEDNDVDDEIDEDGEYYVSSLSSDKNDGYMFFVESIYGSTDIKQFECDCEMMIFNEFDAEEVEEYVEARSIGYYEYDREDDDSCDCDDCCGCENEELSDSHKAELALIHSYYESLLATDGCPDCILKILVDAVNTFKEIGYKDHQDMIREFNEED